MILASTLLTDLFQFCQRAFPGASGSLEEGAMTHSLGLAGPEVPASSAPVESLEFW